MAASLRPAGLALGLLVAAGIVAPAGAESWMLMGREGGCVSLAAAGERKELLRGVASPEALVARLKAQGEPFERREISQGGATVVQIEVTSQGLGLIFVPRHLCP